MPEQGSIYQLKGAVQHYSWGGFDFIPQLLGIEKAGKPYAEYWLGAHPSQPAEIAVHGDLKKLDAFLKQAGKEVLGDEVFKKFGNLPYLLKVLDVRQMLSIQVHPGKAAAAAAFEAENNKGISLQAPNRNYKDANHKPELMVALSDFWLLHGFKPAGQLMQLLEAVPYFYTLKKTFDESGYRGLYESVMTMPQGDVDALLHPLVTQLLPLYQGDKLSKNSEDFWAARAAQSFCKNGTCDRGIFSIYFFNLVHLKKGEGIYQPAGLPHAYLEGQNIEIMAASDNVLRAGLTDKHVDVAELMKHVHFSPTVPAKITDDGKSEMIYKSEAAEFELSKIVLQQGDKREWTTRTAEIILQTQGATSLDAQTKKLTLKKGDAVFIMAGARLKMACREPTELFRASVPHC